MTKPTSEKTIDDIITKTLRPWEYEPDFYEWDYRGMHCIARRNKSHGALCGYVDIPSELWNTNMVLANRASLEDTIDVHGGVSFNNYVIDKDAHRIGFDCAHAGDVLPVETFSAMNEGGVYRTLTFVIAECERMVDQIHKLSDTGEKP